MFAGQFDANPGADVVLACDAQTGVDRLLGNGDGTLKAATHYDSDGYAIPAGVWPADKTGPALLFMDPAHSLCYRTMNDLGTRVCPADTSHMNADDAPDGFAPVGHSFATAHFTDDTDNPCGHTDVIASPSDQNVSFWGMNPIGYSGPVGVPQPPCSSWAYTQRAVNGMPAGDRLFGVTTADLNGDSHPDLLMNTYLNGNDLVSLLWETGATTPDSGFPPGEQAVVTPSVSGLDDQQVADFDRDGRADVAVVGADTGETGPGTLGIQIGAGNGSFGAPQTMEIPDGSGTPEYLAQGDFNGDGAPDLVTVASLGSPVTVFLNGSSASSITPVTPGGPGPLPNPPAAPDKVPPSLSSLTLSHTKFKVGPASTALIATARVSRGTTVHYTLSEPSRVALQISRLSSGRRKGRSCVKPTPRLRRAKSCVRVTPVATLTRSGAAGANAVPFSGRIKSRKLAPGKYRMSIVATDAATNSSKAKQLSFTIVPG